RVPTYKEMVEQLGLESPSYGLLGYPLLQSADILMYKAAWVPVGIDQVPHVELTREVARRFNNAFGEVFPEPQAKLTEIPKVPGTDGRKMSKSYGNAIYLSDPPETVRQKVRPMVTDPARKRRSDSGNPDVCPVFDLHRIFTPPPDREYCATGCRTAAIGCLDCKDVLLKHLEPALAPIRERRQAFAEKPDRIVDILKAGSARSGHAGWRRPGWMTCGEWCRSRHDHGVERESEQWQSPYASRGAVRGPARSAAAPLPHQRDRPRRAACPRHHRSVRRSSRGHG